MAKRLWDKGGDLNEAVHAFTVGNDSELDLALAYWDAAASAAHAKMLAAVGLLAEDECRQLVQELAQIAQDSAQGNFNIPNELEDCHTAIEARLTERLGAAGRRIHTGRSRNDQVLTAMRLFLRQKVLDTQGLLLEAVKCFLDKADQLGHLPLPGYTHMQPAMPASLALWLGAFAEGLLENAVEGLGLWEFLDANPLGAAAGFGTPLPLDREMTAKLLGFTRVQRNPINVQNSRGLHELRFIHWCIDSGRQLEKFAWDAILYSSAQYGFISLPEALTTGSSIMPQKRNPDVLELIRGRAAKLRGTAAELEWVIGKLPSNYHRDLQYSKEPAMRAAANIAEMLQAASAVVNGLQADTEACHAAQTPELYATYDAYRRVRSGAAFRDAYRESAKALKDGKIDVAELSRDFAPIAAAADADRQAARSQLAELNGNLAKLQESFGSTLANLWKV